MVDNGWINGCILKNPNRIKRILSVSTYQVFDDQLTAVTQRALQVCFFWFPVTNGTNKSIGIFFPGNLWPHLQKCVILISVFKIKIFHAIAITILINGTTSQFACFLKTTEKNITCRSIN